MKFPAWLFGRRVGDVLALSGMGAWTLRDLDLCYQSNEPPVRIRFFEQYSDHHAAELRRRATQPGRLHVELSLRAEDAPDTDTGCVLCVDAHGQELLGSRTPVAAVEVVRCAPAGARALPLRNWCYAGLPRKWLRPSRWTDDCLGEADEGDDYDLEIEDGFFRSTPTFPFLVTENDDLLFTDPRDWSAEEHAEIEADPALAPVWIS